MQPQPSPVDVTPSNGDTVVYGLHRIIQIDSFIPGIRTVVDLDGHSIVNGTNGAGKSSTLKLLSFFYGGDPSQLDSHSAGRDPFAQFYLPRQTSLLVFEYARESGLCCAVAYRNKSGTKHVYRFLEGGFTEARFSQTDADGKTRYCKGHDLKMHWKQLGLTCSQQIELVMDYRAIIQNDAALINRLADSKLLRRLAASYCLGSRKTHMRYIDRICAAIISRSGNMERMKDMLADIMIEDGVVFPASPIHRADASLATEISSLREFEKEIPRLKAVLKRHYQRLALDTRLKSFAGQANQQEVEIVQSITDKETHINGLTAQLGDLKSQWDIQYDALNKHEIETRNETENCNQQIDALDEQNTEYEEQDLEQKAADLDNLSQFIERSKDAEVRFIALNEDVAAEENTLNRALSKESARYIKEREAAQQRLDEERADNQRQERDYNDKREALSKREYDEKEQVRSQAAPEREALVEARAEATAQANNGGRTDEEALALKDIENHILSLEQALATLNRQADEKTSARQQAAQARDDSDQQLKRAHHTFNRTSDELERLHKLAYAEDGTWLKKLRDSDPAWATQVGKIIAPELLQRKDLDASQTGEHLETVFGWSLNLEVIETPPYAESEEQLRHEYSTQEELLQRARVEVAACEKVCTTKNKAYKTADDAYEQAIRALKQGEAQREDAQHHLRDQNRIIEAAIAERRQAAQKETARLQQDIQAFDETLKTRLQAVETLIAEERSELMSAWSIENSRIQEQIKRSEAALTEISDHHKARKKAINGDYIKACSDKGIDEATLNDARTARDEAEEKVRSVTNEAGTVNAYREWLKTEWPKRESLVNALNRYRKAQSQAEADKADKQRAHDASTLALKTDITEEQRRLRGLNNNRERLNNIKPRLSVYMDMDKEADGDKAEGAAPDSMPFDLLLQEIEKCLDERETLKETLITDIQGINSKIDQFGETQIAKAWQQAKNNLRQKHGYDDVFDQKFLLHLPEALEVFIDKEIKGIRSAKIESVRGVGKGLTDFFEKLLVVHKRIKKQSKKITGAISENMLIDALSTMELDLESRVQTLDYWQSLQNFSDAWQEWRESGEDDLPSQLFLDEMSTLITALHSIKSGHHLRDYFDLHIRMVENGHERIIRNDNQLEHSTSDGLKYLALCVIFIGISRLLCPDKAVKLHWPIDELGILHGDNISRLFKMLNQGGIVMVGGFPSEDPSMLRHFKHRQVIDIHKGIRIIDIPRSSLKERARARRQTGAASE